MILQRVGCVVGAIGLLVGLSTQGAQAATCGGVTHPCIPAGLALSGLSLISEEDYLATLNPTEAKVELDASNAQDKIDDEVIAAEALRPALPVVVADATDGGGSSSNPFGVAFTATDRSGSNVRYRNGLSNSQVGDRAFGYAHARYDHNFTDVTNLKYFVQKNHKPSKPDNANGNFHYKGKAYYDGEFLTNVVVVVSFANNGPDGTTPDGAAYGMITALCEGVTYCPEEINQDAQ